MLKQTFKNVQRRLITDKWMNIDEENRLLRVIKQRLQIENKGERKYLWRTEKEEREAKGSGGT